MTDLIFCEKPLQAKTLASRIEGGEIIVSFNPETNYALERNKVDFVDICHYYESEELWNQYPNYRKKLIQLTNRLDEIVLEVDNNYKKNNLKFFEYLHYIIMMSFDQINFYIYVLLKIFQKHSPQKVTCLETRELFLNENLLFEDSMIGYLVNAFKIQFNYEVEYMEYTDTESDVNIFHNKYSYIYRSKESIKKILRPIKPLLYNIILDYKKYIWKPSRCILSVSCKEVNVIKSALIKKDIYVLSLDKIYPLSKKNSKYENTDKIISVLKKDYIVRSLLTYKEIDYYEIIIFQMKEIFNNYNYYLSGYEIVKKIFRTHEIGAVIFSTMTPFNAFNIFVANLCNENNIPYFCWMHGGYGANYSLYGYMASDYRLAKQHLVYGRAVSNLLESKKCVTNLLGMQGLKSHVVGTPYFERLYRNYKKPNNYKKKILLTIGNQISSSSIYFGMNKPYFNYSNWDEHRAIIKVLVKYQYKYDIVIKDLPTLNMQETWEDLLYDLGGGRIKVIVHEKSYRNVLVESDLHIFTWVSTPFIESLFTDSDIFLLDLSDLTVESKALFKKYICFSSSIDSFIKQLDKYLSEGIFYTQNKAHLKDLFIDYYNKEQRADVVSEAIYSVIN